MNRLLKFTGLTAVVMLAGIIAYELRNISTAMKRE